MLKANAGFRKSSTGIPYRDHSTNLDQPILSTHRIWYSWSGSWKLVVAQIRFPGLQLSQEIELAPKIDLVIRNLM